MRPVGTFVHDSEVILFGRSARPRTTREIDQAFRDRRRLGLRSLYGPSLTVDERLMARIRCELETHCWLWTGPLNREGYGTTSVDGYSTLAHRGVYMVLIGPIPDGLNLDHICHNASSECLGGPQCRHRRCLNPAHLEPVPQFVNCRRGRTGAYLRERTQCFNGHGYTPANTKVLSNGGRRCRACGRERNARYNARRTAVA